MAHWNRVHIPGRTDKHPVYDDALEATKTPLRPSRNQGYDEHDIRTGLTQTTYSTHIPLLTSSSKGGVPTLTTRWTDIGSRPASPLNLNLQKMNRDLYIAKMKNPNLETNNQESAWAPGELEAHLISLGYTKTETK